MLTIKWQVLSETNARLTPPTDSAQARFKTNARAILTVNKTVVINVAMMAVDDFVGRKLVCSQTAPLFEESEAKKVGYPKINQLEITNVIKIHFHQKVETIFISLTVALVLKHTLMVFVCLPARENLQFCGLAYFAYDPLNSFHR